MCARFIAFASNADDVGALGPLAWMEREGLLGGIAQYECEMNHFPWPLRACGVEPKQLHDRHVVANVPWFRRLPDQRDLDQCTFG